MNMDKKLTVKKSLLFLASLSLGIVSLHLLNEKPAVAGCGFGDITCKPSQWTCPPGGCRPGPAPSKIPTQVDTRTTNKQCPGTYSKATFRGRTGKVAFFNQWSKPVTVVIYHPSNSSIFNRYTVPPGQNHILVNGFVGDDWGVCFENLPNQTGFVNNLGQISDYNPNWQGSPLFMIQNPRIRW